MQMHSEEISKNTKNNPSSLLSTIKQSKLVKTQERVTDNKTNQRLKTQTSLNIIHLAMMLVTNTKHNNQ